jgi:hypothetical protein
MTRSRAVLTAWFLAAVLGPAAASAGVVNPDISVLGQPFMRWTNDASDPSPKRVTFDPGEVEMVYDSYLNPYAKGYFVTSLASEGLSLEEGYFTILRGLPGGLALKGGKYRVGFGKLNPMHPHAVPFAERPHVLAAYLPGVEAFNETGVSLSGRVPLPGTFSLTASGDWLQGDSFRIPRVAIDGANDPLAADPAGGDRAGEARPAFVGGLSGFGSIGDRSGYEVGLYATGGTNNVSAAARTTIYDAAGKLKLWTSANAYLLVQAELLRLDREDAGWDSVAAAYTKTSARPLGGYLYADYNLSPRYDAGLSYERYQQPTPERTWDQSVGAFAGLALMEETTSFRLEWNRFMPGRPAGAISSPKSEDTVTLRVIYSMGPHKAHQF